MDIQEPLNLDQFIYIFLYIFISIYLSSIYYIYIYILGRKACGYPGTPQLGSVDIYLPFYLVYIIYLSIYQVGRLSGIQEPLSLDQFISIFLYIFLSIYVSSIYYLSIYISGRKACGYPGTPQLGSVYPLKFIYEVGEQVKSMF